MPDNTSSDLNQLFADEWEFRLRENPLYATLLYGDHRYDDRLPDAGGPAFARRAEARRAFLERLQAIDRAALTPAERLSATIFERVQSDELAEYGFGAHYLSTSKLDGFCIVFADLPVQYVPQTLADYEHYVARLRAFREHMRQEAELLRAGIAAGMVQARVAVDGLPEALAGQLVDDPEQSVFYLPFTRPGAAPAEADRARLAAEARAAIAESIVPGYREFRDFIAQEYLPAAREDLAAGRLPNGRAFYEHRVRSQTTLNVTPEEVHALGQDEVRRIRAEMEATIRRTGFNGDFRAFVDGLRKDPRFFVTTPEQLLKEVAYVLKKMDGMLPRLFKTLPRTPYGILPVPDFIAPYSTTAYYQPPAGDGTRGGTYYVNTYDLPSRPLYEIEALSLHEAVPGHHLQFALQQELANVPAFRRFDGFNAYVEGWALYAERLGLEAGFYQDPYSDFGRLTYEMWRACRLVVDTGIHALGWSRAQSIDFIAANTGLSLVNIANEVDRYVAWPGQALSYKMGELTIRRLRADAEQALGPAFDLRAFHDRVLADGCVPLDVLERAVAEWVWEQRALVA